MEKWNNGHLNSSLCERQTKHQMPSAAELPPKHLNRIKLWDWATQWKLNHGYQVKSNALSSWQIGTGVGWGCQERNGIVLMKMEKLTMFGTLACEWTFLLSAQTVNECFV